MRALSAPSTPRAIVATVVIAAAAHLPALGAGFVWLDHAHLEERAAIAPPAGWPGLLARGFAGTGFHRPLVSLVLSIDALSGAPWVYHASSVAWHALASVAVLRAGAALGLGARAAALAALLFAAHPLSNLVANAIAFRSEAMLAVFLLSLVVAHRRGRALLAGAAIVAGCLTKETAFVLAPLFVLGLGRGAPRRLLATEGAALAAAALLRAAFAPPFRARPVDLGVADAIGTRFAALAKSAVLVVFPFDLRVCDAFVVRSPAHPAALAGLAIAVALAALAVRRRGPALLLLFAVLPLCQIVPVMRWWSPHYLYVPAAFAAMLAGERLDRRGDRAAAAGALAAVLLAVTAFLDSRRYASDRALWTPEVAAQPACREGQFYLGEAERAARRWEPAAARYELALRDWPGVLAFVDRRAALQNLGTVRLEQRRLGEARAAFEAALAGSPDEAARRELVHDLAVVALESGDPAAAERLLAPETARPDALPASIEVRAVALERLGRREDAAILRAGRTSRYP